MPDTSDDILDTDTPHNGTQMGSLSVGTSALGRVALAGDAPGEDDQAGPDIDGGSH